MFQEIYIIDCENDLAMTLREKFQSEKVYKFKNINPTNIDMALKNIPELIIINEQSIKNDTKILLSLLYRNYWCSEEKKRELLEDR